MAISSPTLTPFLGTTTRSDSEVVRAKGAFASSPPGRPYRGRVFFGLGSVPSLSSVALAPTTLTVTPLSFKPPQHTGLPA